MAGTGWARLLGTLLEASQAWAPTLGRLRRLASGEAPALLEPQRESLKRLIIVLLVATALIGGARLLLCPGAARSSDSIVLVILDTVRADRLGCLGGRRGLTPELDRFAAGAAVFTAAYSHAPWTLPSVASLYTGELPETHGAGGHLGSFRSLGESARTLAEVCRDAGLETGAVVNVQFLTESFGMTQGFDDVDAYVPTTNLDVRKAGPTTDAALDWLERHHGRPFLLVVHYFDPHLVYDPPQPFRRSFADPRDRESGEYLFGVFGELQALRRGDIALANELLARLEALYDGEVAYVDHEFGRLLRGLERLGLDDRTVVGVVADHGEEFGDHGSFEHGHTLYDELLHVPLLVRAPNGVAGGRSSAAVRLVDVAPTLLELIGLPPEPSFAGASLIPLLRGAQESDRPVLSMGNMWGPGGASLRQGDWKLVVDDSASAVVPVEDPARAAPSLRSRLFHVGEDPGETTDLAGEHGRRRDAMLADLLRTLNLAAAPRDPGRDTELSDEERRRLRSLGYVD